MNIVSYLLTIT